LGANVPIRGAEITRTAEPFIAERFIKVVNGLATTAAHAEAADFSSESKISIEFAGSDRLKALTAFAVSSSSISIHEDGYNGRDSMPRPRVLQ
jgi:hypothetical protein